MSLSVARKSVTGFLYEWRKPIIIALGVGAGVGLITVLARFWRKRILSRKEVVNEKRIPQKALSNRVLIIGLDKAGKSLLLAALTHQPFAHLSASDGFHSVMIKPKYLDKTIEFVEVPGKMENRQYWSKFTTSARIVFVVVDVNNLATLGDLSSALTSCLPEAKKLGVTVYYIFNNKGHTVNANELEAEKFLCLEGLVKNPSKEIIATSLQGERSIEKLEEIINSHFCES